MSLTDYACADQQAHIFAYHADALAFLRTLPDNWCHAVVCDPPYGLADHRANVVAQAITAWAGGDRERVPSGRGFMGREWDSFVPPPAVWDECLRVLKPGGHLAVFAGSRTVDLMGLSIRLAGFELRDGIAAWLYGSGFPKSLDVGKAIDKAAGATREVVGTAADFSRDGANRRTDGSHVLAGANVGNDPIGDRWSAPITAPATDAARAWSGWGTALKPAHEPIILARKPLGGTVAATVLAHGAGAVNVDACRVAHASAADLAESVGKNQHTRYANPGSNLDSYSGGMPPRTDYDGSAGRWPTNVVLAHHPYCGPDEAPGPCVPGCQVVALDEQSGERPSGGSTHERSTARADTFGQYTAGRNVARERDSGGASRFYPTFRYQAKAPKGERPQVFTHSCRCEDPWPTTSPARATDEATTAGASSTSRSGSDTTDGGSPMGTTSITSTSTSSTTIPGTSSSSTSSRTSGSTPDASSATASGGSRASSAVSSSPSAPSTGTSPAKGGRSTDGAARATSRVWSETSVCGSCDAPSRLKGHETVKPLGLMRWLVRLLVPAGESPGLVLDPFAGSGTTLEAARAEGVRAVGVEADEHSCRLIAARLGVEVRERPADGVGHELAEVASEADPFDALLDAVVAATTATQLDALRTSPAWAAEHDALALLRAPALPREEAA